MITKVYISHCQEDELLALELAQTLWSVNLESFVAVYRHAQAIVLAERIRFGMRQSDCVVAILTLDGVVFPWSIRRSAWPPGWTTSSFSCSREGPRCRRSSATSSRCPSAATHTAM